MSNTTHQKIVRDPALDSEQIANSHAVFNLHSQGMDILMYREKDKNIRATGSFYWSGVFNTDDLIYEIEETLLAEKLDFDRCLSVTWCISSSKFTLIPQDLFLEKNARTILDYTSKTSEDELLLHDLWADQKIVSLYTLAVKLKEWIFLYFSDAQIIHSSTVLNSLTSLYRENKIFTILVTHQNFAELYISYEGNTLFYNQFHYKVEEDLLYYLLYVFEQNGILAPEVDLKLGGISGKGSKLQKLLLDYIGTVEEIGLPGKFSASPAIPASEVLKTIHLSGGL